MYNIIIYQCIFLLSAWERWEYYMLLVGKSHSITQQYLCLSCMCKYKYLKAHKFAIPLQ